MMRALSVRQPWASLIVAGLKTHEFRTWDTPYRGPLVIHAAKLPPTGMPAYVVAELPRGCFVGTARLAEIDYDTAIGLYVWHLAEARAFPAPVPAVGRPGLWSTTLEETAA